MPSGVYLRSKEHKRKLSESKKGKKLSEEYKQKISKALKGIKFSEEYKRKIGLFWRGKKRLPLSEEHKQKISIAIKGEKHWLFGKHLSEEYKNKISEKLKGRKISLDVILKSIKNRKGYKHSEETKRKIGLKHKGNKYFLGKHHSEETRQKMSKRMKGDKSNFWKGGITSMNEKIRKSLKYRLWRESVFKRDNYQCIWGGKNHGYNLNADHIKSFALFPELRFDLSNGRTLCEDCHKKTDTYGCKLTKAQYMNA